MDSMTEALDKFYAEDFIEAAEICQDALKANPKGAEAYFILGMVSLRFDNPGRAISLMEEAHELDTDCREYSDALASLLTRIGKLSEGLFYAKLSVAQEPHPVLFRPGDHLGWEGVGFLRVVGSYGHEDIPVVQDCRSLEQLRVTLLGDKPSHHAHNDLFIVCA
jgi:tetratricopeptide (TPR) repeat protein